MPPRRDGHGGARVAGFRFAAGALALLALVLAAYAGVRGHSFVRYDDPLYVTDNRIVQRGLSADGLRWAFTSGHAANWHPLTWLSHMLDVELFGLDAAGHHLVSLLWHAAAALALGGALLRLTGRAWPSLLAAALFAVHPLHVESVAWVAERKDVLSAFFMFLTLGLYARYARRPTAGGMATVVLAFSLGLLAKPMVVTAPFVLLLLDWWPLGRWTPGRPGPGSGPRGGSALPGLLAEKLPLFALSLGSSVVTYIVQQAGGAMSLPERLSLAQRTANALLAYVAYLGKTLWPSHLGVFYPHPGDSIPLAGALAAALLLSALGWGALRASPRQPYLTMGWLWYLGTLVPVIGLIQVGSQGMADRYTYIPLVGLFVAAAWGAADLARAGPRARMATLLAVPVVLAALVLATRAQVRFWRTSLDLFAHAVAVIEDNWLARINLGAFLEQEGRLAEAETQLREAVRLRPGSAIARMNLARAVYRKGDRAEAESLYRLALELDPALAEARNNLGRMLLDQGRDEEALRQLAAAVEGRPDFVPARNNLGTALLRAGRVGEARAQFAAALRLDPRHADALNNLGWIHAREGDYDQAISRYAEALRANPSHRAALNNMGAALLATGRREEAMSYYQRAMNSP